MSPGLSRERMNNKHGSGGWGRLGRVSNVQFPRWPFLWGYREIMKVTEPGLPGSNTWWSEVSWHNNYKNKVHNKCNVLKSPQNHSSLVCGKLPSMKPILGAKNVGDHCLTRWHQMPAKSLWPQPQEWADEPLPMNTHAPLVFPVDSLPAFLNLSLSFSAFGPALYLMKWLV